MTKHIVTPGTEATFAISNGYAPAQGPRACPITLDFTTDNQIDIDFTKVMQANGISFIQSAFVDNSANPNALTLTIDITGQPIVIPAFAQMIAPVIATNGSKCIATTTVGVGVIAKVLFLNVPMPLTQTGPITVNVAAVNLVPTTGTYTNRSGTIAVGGTSQQIMAVNANRKRMIIQNPGNATESLFINFTAAADTTGANSLELLPGGVFDSTFGPVSTEAINVNAATGGHVFSAKEM